MLHLSIFIKVPLTYFFMISCLSILKFYAKGKCLPDDMEVEDFFNISNKIQRGRPQQCVSLKVHACFLNKITLSLKPIKEDFRQFYKTCFKQFNEKINTKSSPNTTDTKRHKRSLEQDANQDHHNKRNQEKSAVKGNLQFQIFNSTKRTHSSVFGNISNHDKTYKNSLNFYISTMRKNKLHPQKGCGKNVKNPCR